MSVPASVIASEIEAVFRVAPPYKTTPDKENQIAKDMLDVAESWDEAAFRETCKQVRRKHKSFPTIDEIQQLYWQVEKDSKPKTSEQEDLEADHRRREREHNETWAQVSCSKDFPWILEQATDEIDAALEKLEKKNEDGHVIMDAKGQLAQLLRRHREDSIRSRACEIWKETRE